MKILLFAGLLAASGPGWAGPLLFTGTPPTLGSGVTLGQTSNIFTCCGVTRSAAVGFTVPSGTAYSLDNIQVFLVSDGNSPSPLSALLYQDAGGNPGGSPVADLSRSITIFNAQPLVFTLTPSAAFTLIPSTTYWLVLNAIPADDRNISWMGTSDANPYSGVLSYAGSKVSNSAALPSAPATSNLIFAVDGTALTGSGVPEPGTLVLLGAGLAALFRLRRDSSKEQAPEPR